MIRFNQFIKTIILEAKLEHFVHLNLDPENEHHNELLNAFNNNKERLTKKHPAQYKDIGDLSKAVSPYIKSPEVAGATLIHHNKETGAKVYHVHTNDAACKLSSDTWCTSKGGFPTYDKGRSFVIHLPNEPDRNLRKIGIFGDNDNYDSYNHGFQDAANKGLSDDDWNTLRKKHNLDKIPALMGIRGIPISNTEKNNRSNELTNKIQTHINNNPNDTAGLEKLLSHKDISPDNVKPILDTNDKILHSMILPHHKLLNNEHMNTLFKQHKDDDNFFIPIIHYTPYITDDHINYILNKHKSTTKHSPAAITLLSEIAKRPTLSPEQTKTLFNFSYKPIDTNLLEHIKGPILDGMIDRHVINKESVYSSPKYNALTNPNLSANNITKILNHNNSDVDYIIARHKNLDNTHIDTLISRHGKFGSNSILNDIIFNSPHKLTKQHKDKLNKYNYPYFD